MRLADERNVKALTDKLNAAKRISKGINEDDVKKLLATIDAINALEEDATEFKGRLLDKWEVPSSLKVLFYPAAIRADVTTKLASDVLDREELADSAKDAVDYIKFTELCDVIAGLFKHEAKLTSKVSEFRTTIALMDAVKKMAFNECVRWDGDSYFVPYKVKSQINLGYKVSYFNASVNDVMEELILHAAEIFSME